MTKKETTQALETAKQRYVVRGGRLYWKCDAPRAKKGDPAGCMDSKGYFIVRIAGALFKAHRVIFAMYHGRWPEGDLDHRNGDRADNRIRNLRVADRSQNMWNRKAHVTSKTGVLGVCRAGSKWRAQMYFNRQSVLRKDFDTLEEAVAARRAAERKYFGKFAPSKQSSRK